ncbi:DNA-binding transcriptional regulator, MerR family [Virgibacillus subterraneus]|uniref:DNA-binding transcriptional regulator, MerR family n=1 Tax=Virgibacillus subterraneus TaxID=621109 RepID=A0A1H9I765_9BACI|nr:MerR family transcriptional regulator [Virgibacillus subterraneus]SEQ70531.1 DNA-binding transcriptional regulator, MerR family [Virgibacillus subterraneus]
MKRLWKIGELAKIAGLTVRTLRYYDQIRLFSPSEHTYSGHRLYNESDITVLQQILSLKELGLTLNEIKSVQSGDRFSPIEIISLQITRLKENISMQEKLLMQLENMSSLMHEEENVSVEDFTKLLGVMRMNHDKYFIAQRNIWEKHLERLGDHLSESLDNAKKGSELL